MNCGNLLLFAFFLNLSQLVLSAQKPTKLVVCYWSAGSVYQSGVGKFDVENIDPNICTHLIYAFAGVSPNGTIRVGDPARDLFDGNGTGAYFRFNWLREENPYLTTMIGVGGWGEDPELFSNMSKTEHSRRVFIESVLRFLYTYGFQGLDMDWEYPTFRGGVPADKKNFALLMRELKNAFLWHDFVLSAAIAANRFIIDSAYDLLSLSMDLDFFNVMCYDYHGTWELFTGHHAPMNQHPLDLDATGNINSTIHYLIAKGVPREKIILGMGAYGRGFPLVDPHQNGPHSPANVTSDAGYWLYYEFCEKLLTEADKWTVVYEPHYMAPYAYTTEYWVGFDTPKSIRTKAKFAKNLDLGGGMIWGIDTDDFLGRCHNKTFPLIKSIFYILNEFLPSSLSSESKDYIDINQTTSPVFSLTPLLSSKVCLKEGVNADPHGDCLIFYQCARNNDTWIFNQMTCPLGTVFDRKHELCNHPDFVPACKLFQGKAVGLHERPIAIN